MTQLLVVNTYLCHMFSDLNQLRKGHSALGRQTAKALNRVRLMHRHDVTVEHFGEAELFAALGAGVAAAGPGGEGRAAAEVGVLPRLVPHQPALRGEGLVTALKAEEVRIAITISNSYIIYVCTYIHICT